MKPQNDYGFIRGICHPGAWIRSDRESIERELGYAQRLNLNSSRIWLMKRQYDTNPDTFVQKLVAYVRTAYTYGITTMPILWNGNGLDVNILDEKNWLEDDKYVTHIVNALKDEEGLIMWDLMNEPSCNDYIRGVNAGERAARWEQMTKFLWHTCEVVRSADPSNAITIGHTFVEDIQPTAECVDVISFHDYLETRTLVENTYLEAKKLSETYQKPLVNSEMACLGRSNPYDMALEICDAHKIGWYLFELMIHGYWGDVHGIVYPDGTIRDPAIVAAIYGFYRRRDKKGSIKPDPNKEGHVYKAIEKMESVLKQDTTLFRNRKSSTDNILEAAEYCANLLEGCEMVPMYEPPTMSILAWRRQAEEERDSHAIREFAYALIQTLKKSCQII